MDYGKLNDRRDDGEEVEEGNDEEETEIPEAKNSVTMMVLQESLKSSVWAYQVDRKGAAEDWVAPQVVHDLETVGLQKEFVVIKSD